MNVTLKICSFIARGENKKQAYLNGCKKVAKFWGSKKYKNVSCKIERISKDENALLFVLFTTLDLGKEKSQYCKMCKEMHCSFFINEDYNCSSCKLEGFFKKVKEKALVSKNFYKTEFKKEI